MLDHFGLLAPFYERLIPPPDPERWLALLRLPTAGRLLDAGGGTGRVSAVLRPYVKHLIISDESAKMLAQAQTKDRCCPVLGAVERLPFGDGLFERIMVVDALHHFADQQLAVAELVRVLQPGGRLVIEEPDLRLWAIKMLAVAEKATLMRSKFYYPQAIADLVTAHGAHVSLEYDGRFAVWVIADKV